MSGAVSASPARPPSALPDICPEAPKHILYLARHKICLAALGSAQARHAICVGGARDMSGRGNGYVWEARNETWSAPDISPDISKMPDN